MLNFYIYFQKTLSVHKLNISNQFSFSLDMQPTKELKATKTAADEGYLTEFYSNSRLHYISTLGSMLKQHVQKMREKHDGIFPERKKLLESLESKSYIDESLSDGSFIMHIDMDCFFVSVALRNYPHLKGQPVAVTHAKSNNGTKQSNVDKKFEVEFYKKKMESKIRSKQSESDSNNSSDNKFIADWSEETCSMSEIASCSYEARKAGVYKGMYLGAALKLCPNLKTVPYDFEGYKEVSMTLYNIVAKYTLDIEAISCDELFIDCTSFLSEVKMNAFEFAKILRQEIEAKTNCTSSIGIGKNKLQAKLANKHAKPNGQFYLTQDKLDDFMKNLDVYDIPGIGRTIGAQLRNLSVKTCGDLQKFSLLALKKEFGEKTGKTLYLHCRGIDDRKVNFNHERKSVSAEVNYGIRFNDDEETETFLKQLSEEVSKRLKDEKRRGRNITFKVMFRAKDAPLETAKYLGHGACDTISKSLALPFSTNEACVIAQNAIKLYHQLSIPANELRGIGIQITKLECVTKTFKSLRTYFEKNKEERCAYKQSNTVTSTVLESDSMTASTKKNIAGVSLVPEENLFNERLPSSSQLDFEVLASLPEKIRLEILNEYGIVNFSREKNQENNRKTSDSDLKNNYQQPITSDFKMDNTTQNFFKLNLNELKVMIKEWMVAEQIPQSFDVDILKMYLKNLVKKKSLEELCILIRCLHRHIKSLRSHSEIWHKIYYEIVDEVQDSMKKIFGKTLANETVWLVPLS